MRRHLFFKKRRHSLPLFAGIWTLRSLLIAALAGGCSSIPCRMESDRGSVGLCGPVKSFLLEMGGTGIDSTQRQEVRPREYREFDREGHLVKWVVFGKGIADTVTMARRYYDVDGLCVKMIQGKPGPKKKWSWERVEYAYDSSDALLWQAEFSDSLDLVPHTVFCYSSNAGEESACLGRWKSVRTLKVIYQNERGVPLGEQWVLNGTSYGAIRYDVDTVESRGRRYVRYRLPTENIVNESHRYVANFYDDGGKLIEQWGYLRESLMEGIYSYADLADIHRFDSLGRTIFQLSVGSDTASSMSRMAFEFDERGNLLKRVKVTYDSFAAFMRGEISEEDVQDRFEYGEYDKYGNWKSGITKGEEGRTRAVLRRTFEYY